MFRRHLTLIVIGAVIAIGLGLHPVNVCGADRDQAITEPTMLLAQKGKAREPEPPDMTEEAIEATIINPFRSANVGTEVGGIIQAFHFEEGQLIKKGQPVAEISPKRYKILYDKAVEVVKGMEFAHKRALQDLKLKKELLASDAITRQEVLKAATEVDIAVTRLRESQREQELAELNLSDCVIKAPFTGYLAVRYKQPFEPIERLEKLFALVDSAKVYAVANIAEDLLGKFTMGTVATFEDATGRKFTGTVKKIGKLIDPKSKTKRVYVLIDNAGAQLEIGMTGSLHLGR